jgi:large subunit ribosomal protein L33
MINEEYAHMGSVYGGKIMRVKITLACTECKQRNYDSMKNKKNDPDRVELSKYCKFCKKHTAHRETK